MRIGIITTSYPRFAGDSAGSFVAGHVGALRALGHDVEVIAAGDPTGASRDRAVASSARSAGPDSRRDDAAVIRVGASRLFYRGGAPDALERSPVRAAAAAAVFVAQLTRAVAARAPRWDTIIAHWLAPSALAALPARAPLLAIAHGGDVFTLRRLGLLRPVLAALHRRRARLVFVSAGLCEIARAAAPGLARWLDGALVQPMGIDAARFAALPRAPGDPPTVFVAARLVPIKGVDVAIAAMPHVRRPAQLVIAGDGPERARLATAPGAHRWLGEITAERRDAWLGAAAVVVIPSRVLSGGRTEGTPMIALEALAAGVPVVASAVGGLRDLVGNGVELVAPEDPRQLARAIDRMLALPPDAAALRARVSRLDWREVAVRLLRA